MQMNKNKIILYKFLCTLVHIKCQLKLDHTQKVMVQFRPHNRNQWLDNFQNIESKSFENSLIMDSDYKIQIEMKPLIMDLDYII